MSASNVKATRRELRRAIGVSALGEVQQLEEAVRTLGTAVNAQRTAVSQIATHQAAMQDALAALTADVSIFQSRNPWRARLRWLLTGR